MGIIIKPIVTEKMTSLGEKYSRYGFRVSPDANKLEIKKEIENLSNVTGESVNKMKVAGKKKSRNTKDVIIKG